VVCVCVGVWCVCVCGVCVCVWCVCVCVHLLKAIASGRSRNSQDWELTVESVVFRM